jgi:hypothetical protein
MASAAWALQLALHQALTSDPALVALLGGPHVWDHVPRGASYPLVSIGITSERDWSTGSDVGGEHIVTLHAWSKAAGRQETDAITAAMRGVLHDAPLDLDGYRLVNLRHELTDVRRDADNDHYHGVVRLRAVTESL